MTFYLVLYELAARFKGKILWKLVIGSFALAFTGMIWQVSPVVKRAYLVTTPYLKPVGSFVTEIFAEKEWQYAWNYKTYHYGYKEVATKSPLWAKSVTIYRGHRCNSASCLTASITHSPGVDPEIPTVKMLRALFPAILKNSGPRYIIGHVPYRYNGDLVRYWMPTKFSFEILQRDGFSWFDNDVSDKTKRYVKAWLDRGLYSSTAVICHYKDPIKNVTHALVYWYEKMGAGGHADWPRYNPDHPMIDWREPVISCPKQRED